MGERARDINHGECMFCGGNLLYCNDHGNVDKPTHDWITCGNSDCMPDGSCISADKYRHPYTCEESDNCPHYDEWHDDDCSNCSKQDCDDCDRGNCDDCDKESCDDCGTLHDITQVLLDMNKTIIQDGDRFRPIEVQDMRDYAKKIAKICDEKIWLPEELR